MCPGGPSPCALRLCHVPNWLRMVMMMVMIVMMMMVVMVMMMVVVMMMMAKADPCPVTTPP